jgi:hypothetical protein
MPDAAKAPDFWRSFAATFRNDHSMVFELFNKPHPEAVRPGINVLGCWRNGCQIPGEGWRAAGMQQLIDSIRSSGATQPILVPGINYSAVLYHPAGQGVTTPAGWLSPGIRPDDTLNPPQLAASNHMYDNSYDNTDLGCPNGSTPGCWDNRLGIIAAQVPLVTTELGEHDCDRSATFINSYMDWADTKPASGRDRVSYLAWTFNADYNCNDANTTPYRRLVRHPQRGRTGTARPPDQEQRPIAKRYSGQPQATAFVFSPWVHLPVAARCSQRTDYPVQLRCHLGTTASRTSSDQAGTRAADVAQLTALCDQYGARIRGSGGIAGSAACLVPRAAGEARLRAWLIVLPGLGARPPKGSGASEPAPWLLAAGCSPRSGAGLGDRPACRRSPSVSSSYNLTSPGSRGMLPIYRDRIVRGGRRADDGGGVGRV